MQCIMQTVFTTNINIDIYNNIPRVVMAPVTNSPVSNEEPPPLYTKASIKAHHPMANFYIKKNIFGSNKE
jgi:hypothetical protein